MAAATEQDAAADLDDYQRARFHAARAAGLTRLEAARFAHGQTPLRTLRRLRADGCPGSVIARIVCALAVAPTGAFLLEASRVALGF